MKIAGECKRCGACCLYGQAFQYRIRDAKGMITCDFVGVNEVMKDVVAPCEQLTFDIHTHEAICNIYDQRPLICRRFPYHEGELIFRGCGYSVQE